VLLILLGIVFFVLEATVTSYGVLAIGGVVSMVLGSLMLIKTDAPFLQISWAVIIPVVTAAAAFSLLIVGMGVSAMRSKPVSGREGMVGLVGVARTPLSPQGKIFVRGELWDAVSEQPLKPGDRAEVTHIEGLKLFVKPVLNKGDAL
jgi:membrane-bound serine protease (ClpP class)